MTLSEAAILWASSFAMVFLLGFQSRAAMAGIYPVCFVTSVAITAAQMVFVRQAVSDDFLLVLAVSGTGAGAGICFAIYVSQHVIRWFARRGGPR